MKPMLMVVALAAVLAPASIGSAAAQDRYRSADARYYCDSCDPTIAEQHASQWPGGAQRRRTYAWPDQRYYGVHGMMYD
ncbi:MAG: hypothetical protein ACR65U_07565 [Methylocystis sp.]